MARGFPPKLMAHFRGQVIAATVLARQFGLNASTVSGRARAGKRDEDLIRKPKGPGAWKGSKTAPTTRYGDFHGEQLSVRELAKLCSVAPKTILERIRAGKRDDDLIAPVKPLKERINMMQAGRNIQRVKNKLKEELNEIANYRQTYLRQRGQEEASRYRPNYGNPEITLQTGGGNAVGGVGQRMPLVVP